MGDLKLNMKRGTMFESMPEEFHDRLLSRRGHRWMLFCGFNLG